MEDTGRRRYIPRSLRSSYQIVALRQWCRQSFSQTVARPGRLTRNGTRLLSAARKERKRGTSKGGGWRRRAGRGDVSGYQRIVAYDRSLFPSNTPLSNGIPWHSLTILLLSPSLLTLCSFPLLLPRLFPHPGTPYVVCLLLVLYSCRSSFPPISTPFLSSRASTRLPNTAISALSPLRHFNYEMINSQPVCPASPFLPSIPRLVACVPFPPASVLCFQRG